MKFTLTIDLDNAAFQLDDDGTDFNRLYLITMLGAVAGEVSKGGDSASVLDLNGNTVGAWSVQPS